MPNLAKPAPSITPICPYFYVCGGCESQDIPYKEQLTYKEQWLKDLFAKAIEPNLWQPIIGSPEEYPVYFRNKIRFGFVHQGNIVRPSRHQKGSDNADIPVELCFLLSPTADLLMNLTARAATDYGWTLYDPKTKRGWLKHLLIREGKVTGEYLVSLVTDEGQVEGVDVWTKSLQEAVPALKSIYHSQSWGSNNTEFNDTLLWGEPGITDKIREFSFFISPHSFFQTNGSMVGTLYAEIAKQAALTGLEHVWDLYAGSATIGIFLSQSAGKVTSIESNPANHADAAWNLEHNAIANVSLYAGLVEDLVTSAFCHEVGLPDIVIVDPPRAGLHAKFRNLLPNLNPKKIIYVSCNPVTCYRDLLELQGVGYRVTTAQGIDMFPHTWHCELVLTLERS